MMLSHASVRKRLIIPTLLLLLAMVVGFFKLPIILGTDFVFGSIITVIVIMLYGPLWGIGAALLSSIYTLFFWEHPFALIIFTLEAVFIGFAHRKTQRNIVLIDGLYWFLIGLPLVILFYYKFMEFSWTSVQLVFLKQSLNGIFNAIIGYLLANILNMTLINRKQKVSYSNIIFTILITFVLVPTFGYVMYEGQVHYHLIQNEVRQTIETTKQRVKDDLNLWFKHNMTPIKELGLEIAANDLTAEEIQKRLPLMNKSLPEIHTLYVGNEKGETIAFAPEINEKGQSTVGLDFSDRAYFQRVKNEMRPLVSDVFLGRGGVFEPIVTLNAPIVKDNQFKGFVTGAVNLNEITRRLELYTMENLDLTILDTKDTVIVTTEHNWKPLNRYAMFSEMEKVSIGHNLYYVSSDISSFGKLNKTEESFYTLIEEDFLEEASGYTLIINMPIKPIYESIYEKLNHILTLALLVLLAAILIGNLVTRKLIYSLDDLANRAKDLPLKIKEGKLGTGHWQGSNIKEINILLDTFETMENQLLISFEELKHNKDVFKHIAHHDSLTGLPNKLYFIEEVQKRLTQISSLKAILFIDLDNFKVINDHLGHDMGDKLLIQIAHRLKGMLTEGDFIARQGGDEFLIYLNALDTEKLKSKADSILDMLAKPVDLEGGQFTITATIGAAIYPSHAKTVEDLLKHADLALYYLKERGQKNKFYIFEEKLTDINQHKMELEHQMRKALELEEFILYYQPLVDLENQNVIGSEALIRWVTPDKEVIAPLEFITLVEETGLIIPIGEWVLRRACQQNKTWQEDTGLPLSVAVNVSMKQFLEDNFITTVKRVLNECGLSPEYLTLEITESHAMENLDQVVDRMKELREFGIKLALDDFGTGYSSLSYLNHIPITELKIDKSFIDELVTNKYNQTIVEAMIKVAHVFNLEVVAEGVEEDEQRNVLKNLGCNHYQGYLYSQPLPAIEFEERILKETLEAVNRGDM